MPPSPDLIDLEQTRQTGAPLWGSKASALGELLARGFPVPAGICLSIPAFQRSQPDGKISPSLESALRSAAGRLFQHSPYLAVRSSAAAEDLPAASFAGLYQSVLGITDPADIGKAVEAVWRSYASPPAASYRAGAARGGDREDDPSAGMGVLIQSVIRADVAGVCFSVDPVQPLTGRLVINACWGMGAGVVDGSIPADTFWLRREDLAVVERRIVEKDVCLTLDAPAGLVRSPVSGALRRAETLPADWASRIAQFALAAEQVFACPQDVEWAIADGKVWILQSRPVASLHDLDAVKSQLFPLVWEHPGDERRFWTRTRFKRQGSAPLLPIDLDYIRLLESTRLETCLLLGADRNLDMRVVHGWVYTSPAPLPVGGMDLRIRRQAFRDLDLRLLSEGRTAWDHWGPEIERANARLAAVDSAALDAPGLANFLEEAMATRRRHNILHPAMRFTPLQPYFDAFQAVSGLSGAEAESGAYLLIEAGESPLTRLIDALYRLAEEARRLPEVAGWIRRAVETPQGMDDLSGYPIQAQGAAAWFVQFQAFLVEFGDRNGDGYGSEALVTTPTWRDRPIQVVQLVAQFLDERVASPIRQRQQSRRLIDAEVDALCVRCPDGQAVENFRKQLRMAGRMQAVIELHNHHIEQIGLGQLRRAVLAAAGWLRSAGILTDAEDVFWLTFAEILALLRQPERESPAKIIQARRESYQKWAQLKPLPCLGLPPAVLSSRPAAVDALTPLIPAPAGQIQGVGASPGVASGRARVVAAWQTVAQLLPGDILVAENAGPLWLPFFPVLAGIVLESGSVGQHAAATAREYGLPAVIAVPDATRHIQDGDWITIDGVKGIVELGRIP